MSGVIWYRTNRIDIYERRMKKRNFFMTGYIFTHDIAINDAVLGYSRETDNFQK